MRKKAKVEQKLSFEFPATSIPLNDGEKYAGLVLDESGRPDHHLILLPGETSLPWKEALAWAKEQGGDLPDRREQALLYANLQGDFQSAWYWSNTPHASDSDYAWGQYFGYGYQDSIIKRNELRARAVRRSPI